MDRAERPSGFPTEATLADQDAEATELRQELDDLRRQLDGGPPPIAAVRKHSRRPLVLAVLIVGGLLGAIVTAVLHGGGGHSSSAPSTLAPSAQRSAQPSEPPTGGPAPAPRAAPPGSLPASGPGIDSPGTMMVVQVSGTGVLNVVEQAVLGSAQLRQITLALPSMTSLGGAVADLHPAVRRLRVSVNGQPVNATTSTDDSGWAVPAGSGPLRTVQLSYQITNTLMRSRPSSAGRALAVSVPLLGQALRAQGLPLLVEAQGAGGTRVNAVSCPSAPAKEMLCGVPVTQGWLATVPAQASSPVVLLQLNLKH
jgi:hypothetical protein